VSFVVFFFLKTENLRGKIQDILPQAKSICERHSGRAVTH